MGIVCTQQIINFAAIVDSLLTLWLMLSVLDMLGEVPVAAAVRMDDNVSLPCPTLLGIVMKDIGSLSGSTMLEEEEEDWAAKQRNDREGGARAMHLPPAAASSSTTGRQKNNNSWCSSSSSNGCVVSILESGANTSFIFYGSWLAVVLS